MSFPDYYGKNLDAFNDVLSDVATFSYGSDPATVGTVLAIADFDVLLHIDHRTGRSILEIFARQARLAALYGHPMLCLVETIAADLGTVGDVDVYEGTVWDTPPDPPVPFEEADVLEFGFRIYATSDEAAGYVSALDKVVAPVLGEIGRWQILDPALVPENSVRFHREHPSARRQPGQQFWDVFIGVRGVGDAMALGERSFAPSSGRACSSSRCHRPCTTSAIRKPRLRSTRSWPTSRTVTGKWIRDWCPIR